MSASAERWGFMMNRLHDQLHTAHLLKDDNAPACGARYYTSPGAAQYVSEEQKCRNCRRMSARASKAAARAAKAGA